VYVEAIDESVVGPAVLVQVIPVTPVIVHAPVPVGTAPPVGPVTVAVKVKVEPSAALALEVVTRTVGVALAMLMLNGADGPVAL
jgi:hypothetical protein